MSAQDVLLDVNPTAEEVADSASVACWSVEERAWKQLLPELPDEVIALLATPVVVSTELYQRSVHVAAPTDDPRVPQFLAPAPPARPRHRVRYA